MHRNKFAAGFLCFCMIISACAFGVKPEERSRTKERGRKSLDPSNPKELACHVYKENLHGIIQLDNGSFWKIKPCQEELLKKWKKGDSVFIYPYRKSSTQKIINPSAWVLMNRRLTNGSLEGSYYHQEISEKSLKIHTIDKMESHIILSDGSIWRIRAKDQVIFDTWQKDDAVMVGSNIWRSWLGPSNLLINLTCQASFVAGKCIN